MKHVYFRGFSGITSRRDWAWREVIVAGSNSFLSMMVNGKNSGALPLTLFR